MYNVYVRSNSPPAIALEYALQSMFLVSPKDMDPIRSTPPIYNPVSILNMAPVSSIFTVAHMCICKLRYIYMYTYVCKCNIDPSINRWMDRWMAEFMDGRVMTGL